MWFGYEWIIDQEQEIYVSKKRSFLYGHYDVTPIGHHTRAIQESPFAEYCAKNQFSSSFSFLRL